MTLPLSMYDSPEAREIGSLVLSVVQLDNSMGTLRAAHWRNALNRVGLAVPFFAVHDIGLLATPEGGSAVLALRTSIKAQSLSARQAQAAQLWLETLQEISESEVMERARQWRLGDDLISVLLLKILGPVFERHLGAGSRPMGVTLPLDPELYQGIESQLSALFQRSSRQEDLAFLERLAADRLRLIISTEQIDLDTLRLLGMFGAEASAANAMAMLDLLNVFSSPEANDVVNFSLDLLPSVLETKRASGQQSFSVDGYAGLARRGTLDSLMLSELAFDSDLFDQRFLENEVFYYSREKQREEDRRLHYIVVDATASMRGQRAVFARGLALTLIKKFSLQGEDVYFRFFDSRLYDVQHARARRGGEAGVDVPYVLSFKGEHGRNYAKVFGLLANDLARLARRQRRTPMLYLLTHAECHAPVETIERLATICDIYGVFMMPSTGELDLEYLQLLNTVQVVDEAALNQKESRARRAMAIVDDAAAEERVSRPPDSEGRISRVDLDDSSVEPR